MKLQLISTYYQKYFRKLLSKKPFGPKSDVIVLPLLRKYNDEIKELMDNPDIDDIEDIRKLYQDAGGSAMSRIFMNQRFMQLVKELQQVGDQDYLDDQNKDYVFIRTVVTMFQILILVFALKCIYKTDSGQYQISYSPSVYMRLKPIFELMDIDWESNRNISLSKQFDTEVSIAFKYLFKYLLQQ